MRIPYPNRRDRSRIRGLLRDAYALEDAKLVRTAMAEVARFYHLKPPRVAFVDKPEVMRHALGACHPDGRIVLVHPGRWALKRTCNTVAEWVNVALHELGHYVLWADAERKADAFATAMES